MVKNLPAIWETWVQSLCWEYPLEEGMATHSIFLPGESHGQRSLMGYFPWVAESDMTEHTLCGICAPTNHSTRPPEANPRQARYGEKNINHSKDSQ